MLDGITKRVCVRTYSTEARWKSPVSDYFLERVSIIECIRDDQM